MSRAELEHVLARGLEGKKIRLKNNKLRLSAALHRAIHNSIRQNDWPVIFANSLIEVRY